LPACGYTISTAPISLKSKNELIDVNVLLFSNYGDGDCLALE
jgi:hypothetical protein